MPRSSVASSAPTAAPRNRRERSKGPAPPLEKKRSAANWAVPLVVVLLCAAWLASKAREPAVDPNEIDFAAFGRLPVTYEGRVKPFDTLARNSLRIISDQQTYVDGEGHEQPAIRWLLDVITDSPAARKHKVFRIHNLDVLETLGLKPRKGFRYSINDFESRLEALDEQVRKAQSTKPEQRDLYSKKILELDRKLNVYLMLREAFRMPQLRLESLREDLSARGESARTVLPTTPCRWPYLHRATERDIGSPIRLPCSMRSRQQLAASQGVQASEANPATVALVGILTTYSDTGDQAAAFNRQVASYRRSTGARIRLMTGMKRRRISKSSSTTRHRCTTPWSCTSLPSCWAVSPGWAGPSRCNVLPSGCACLRWASTRWRWSDACTSPGVHRSPRSIRPPCLSAGRACFWDC